MFSGLHLLLYSREPEQDRAFLSDVLDLPSVDAGGGWLIFALPPAEMAVHPAEDSLSRPHAGDESAAGVCYLMCNNLEDTLARLAARGVVPGAIRSAEWGVSTSIPLPSGIRLGLYEPHHPLAAGKWPSTG